MILYKYTKFDRGFENLETLRIRFTPPAAFNDPFEAFPSYSFDFDDESIYRVFEAILNDDEIIEHVVKNTYKKLETKNFLESLQKIMLGIKLKKVAEFVKDKKELFREALYLKLKSDPEKTRLLFIELMHSMFNESMGVLTLTKLPDNLLMWAHYTDSHKGIVVGFDTLHPFFTPAEEIKYSEERPYIKFTNFNITTETRIKMGRDIFFIKGIDWSYEKEYRIIRDLSLANHVIKPEGQFYPIHLFDLPKESIKEVIVGFRCHQKNIDRLTKMIEIKFGGGVKILKSSLDQKNYKLVFEQI